MAENMIPGLTCGHGGSEVRTAMGDGAVLIEDAGRGSVGD